MSSAAGASAPPRSPAAAAPALLGPREPHGEAFASTSAYILGSHWLSPLPQTSPIPKTAPIGITLNPRLLKCGRQLGEEAGSVPAFLPSDRCHGPLRKHPIVDHPRAGTAATVTIRILPISLAERGTGMIRKGEKTSNFAFFPPLGSSALWGMRRRRLRLPRPGDGVDDSRGRRGGEAARARGHHVCKPKKSHVRAGSVLRPAAPAASGCRRGARGRARDRQRLPSRRHPGRGRLGEAPGVGGRGRSPLQGLALRWL